VARPSSLDRLFGIPERGSSVKTEILAGLTTFLTMSYIVFVNPQVLSFFGDAKLASRGLPPPATATATCLTAGILSIAMGVAANVPIAMAAGMGLNAAVSYQLVLGEGLPMSAAMGIVVAEGLAITLLVLIGVRQAIVEAIPLSLKKAIGAGIGLFIAFIGLQEGGLIAKSDATLVTLGKLTTWPILVFAVGLLLTVVLLVRRVPGAILIGILATTALAIAIQAATGGRAFPAGAAILPPALVRAPDVSTLGRFDFSAFARLGLVKAALLVFAFLLSDFFDTVGTVIAVGAKAGLLDAKGSMPGIGRVLLVDSLGAALGGAASASSNTCYIESASGVAQGGRTGLTAVVTGLCFLAAVFFAPVVGVVPKEATAPALVVVGFLMLSVVAQLDFADAATAFPAFLVVLGIPVTYSISSGIGFGFLAFVLIHALTGRSKEVPWLLWIVAAAFLLDFLRSLVPA
jgi:AGZA family xanthine/uracil permease-like MFS transporter